VTTIARVPLVEGADILGALAAHVDACVRDLRRHPRVPKLYKSGARYRRADSDERWQLPSETHALGGGDCEDLASWRCAELRLRGVPCRVIVKRTAPTVLHAVVEHEDGRIEDPSRALGMGSPERVSGMGPSNLKWKIKRTSDGWEGEATIPLPRAGAAVTARARGSTRGDAAARTLRAIEDVSRSPLVSSLLPPGAGPAIKAALGVARSVAKLFKKKKKKAPSAVQGMPREVGASQIAQALRERGAPPELVRLGAACWGE
jgi:hypothetical protein